MARLPSDEAEEGVTQTTERPFESTVKRWLEPAGYETGAESIDTPSRYSQIAGLIGLIAKSDSVDNQGGV